MIPSSDQDLCLHAQAQAVGEHSNDRFDIAFFAGGSLAHALFEIYESSLPELFHSKVDISDSASVFRGRRLNANMSVMMIRFIVVLSLLVNVACQLKAKAFQAADEEGYPVPSDFPEMEILASKNKPNTAVGFSGGGSRAYTCAVGQLAGLHSLGLIPNIKYLGGVSGGSWAIGAFSYAQNSNSDDELLGPIIPPAKITMDALNLMDQNCMRAVTNTGFPTAIMKWCWHTKSNPVSNFADAWHGAVQSIYFDPRGISAKVRYSYDESTVADIKSRNPDLENAKFFTLANSDRPYPIVTSTLIGPHAGASYQNTTFNFTRIEFTPLYTGDLAHWNVTYHYDNGQVHEYQYGGAIESFAFPIGSSEAPDVGLEVDEKEGSLAVPAPAEIPDVAYGPAVGSFAPGSIMSTVSFINDQTSWDGNYWSPSDPNPVARSYDWADAGVLENMPLLSFVQRGVEKIVIFDNCVTGLHMADVFNPETDQMVTGMIDEAFAAYFGW
jgi:hypothetical protein